MTLKLFKNFTIAITLLSLVAACTDLTNDPNNNRGLTKFGKAQHYGAGKYPRRGRDVAASTLVDRSSANSIFAFASFSNSGNLWDRLRANTSLPDYENQPQVQAQINWFIRNQAYLSRTVNRAAPYMYYISEQVRQRNLPSELVLLPVIESAYNPFVRSSAGASGLWQLMPGTARGFGVKQNFWFDGRRDIYASTNAALDYLTYLQNYFGGDWLLAIAAYDTGEGNVQNAIRRNALRNMGTTFWNLPLAAETRSYVPRLLALAAIIKNPAKYGIVLPIVSDKPYFEQVDVGAQIKLNQAAQLADISLNELKQLNPGYNRNTTDPTGHHKLILPIDRIVLFKERLANLRPAKEMQLAQADGSMLPIANAQAAEADDETDINDDIVQPTKRTHLVRKGETFSTIAKRYKVNVEELKDWNATKVRKGLKPGTTLVVFIEKPASKTAKVAKNSKTKNLIPVDKAKKTNTKLKNNTVKNNSYTVRPGDNLAKVAKKFKMKTAEIKHLNQLKSDALKPGQYLIVN